MSKMKDIRKKSEKDLAKLLAEKREEVRNFRFETAGSKTRDVRAARKNKKEIARIMTELNARAQKSI